MPSGESGLLGRASIRDKLNLLLLGPVLATVLLAAPVVANQVDQARTYSGTANAVFHAVHVSDMLHALQRERLAAVAYLNNAGTDRQELLLRQATVDDEMARFNADMAPELPTDHVKEAMAALRHLDRARRGSLARTADSADIYQVYGRIIESTVGALGMHHHNSDERAPSRPLEIVDSAVRFNEQSSRISAALMITSEDKKLGRQLLGEAVTLRRLHSERFLAAADPPHIALMRSVNDSDSTKELDRLVEQAQNTESALPGSFTATTDEVTDSQAMMREMMVARVVRQIHADSVSEADRAAVVAWGVGVATSLVIVLVIALGVAVSRSIANPVRRLTDAAGAVAALTSAELARVSDEEHVEHRPVHLTAIPVTSKDEVGELATAFNKVQSTAAMMLERQVLTRRNVSMMFASVARRTQNLVGGQLSLIDQLERNQQDPALLAELYQLDHLSMRLRRSAESLLVVSGVKDETRLAVPAQLATVLRSALAEIEDFQRARLVSICDATIAPDAVPDLSLLFAELLENATSYSPPTTVVGVSADYTDAGCRVSIIDHGIGMPQEQMIEENRRFVQRERLDLAPTATLGLFVVGRLARRHGLGVTLWSTLGGGVTAVIDLPSRLLTVEPTQLWGHPERQALPAAGVWQSGQVRPASLDPAAGAPVQSPMPVGAQEGFTWFAGEAPHHAPHPDGPQHPSGPQHPGAPQYPSGPQHPGGYSPPPGAPTPGAAATPDEPPLHRGGLTRRVPGANLAVPQPRSGDAAPAPAETPRMLRDPERERMTLDAFASAVARAADVTDTGQHHETGGRPIVWPPESGAPVEEESTR
ncbi:MAG: nitrate- and nitrite sensing domain-containing protein [Micromonosporaceae bacterium]